MIALTIEVKNSAKQNIDVSTLTLQEIVVSNTADEQNILVIEQPCSQEIDIDTAPLQEIDVRQDGIVINVYDVPFYEGEYKVTPKFTDQTLPMAQRILKEDVVVEKIPVTRVSNTSGGKTVIIGG